MVVGILFHILNSNSKILSLGSLAYFLEFEYPWNFLFFQAFGADPIRRLAGNKRSIEVS